jgi:hypothetical protein
MLRIAPQTSTLFLVVNDDRIVYRAPDYPTAALMLLAMTDPDLYALVQKICTELPSLQSRAIEAGRIIASGAYLWLSEDTPSTYANERPNHPPHRVTVSHADGFQMACTCSDPVPPINGIRPCKHILAHSLLHELIKLDTVPATAETLAMELWA